MAPYVVTLSANFCRQDTTNATINGADHWENRLRFVLEVYRGIRKEVGDDFPVGIKLNSADFMKGGFTEEESMQLKAQRRRNRLNRNIRRHLREPADDGI